MWIRSQICIFEPLETTNSKAENIIKGWYKKNDLAGTAPFPMRLLAEQPWGKDLLKGSYWEGVIDLSDNEARRYFEKYLGIK